MNVSPKEFFHGRTAVVTGGAGLIGSFLVEKLLGAGARVIVVDDFSKGRRKNLNSVLDHVEVREGDLEERAFTDRALTGADVVFHLASRAYGVGYGQGHHLEILQHNERITNNLLDALVRSRPNHLLITSSSCVYADDGPDTIPELPLFEGEPERVNRGYGWAKRFLEQKALLYAQEAGIRTSIVRPFNIYGERYNWVGQYSQAIPMLVKRVMDGEDPVVIWGSGNQRRNYLHAEDCARAMMGVMASGFGDPVNLGTEETVTVRDLVELICRLGGVSPRLEADTTKPEGRFIKSSNSSRLCSVLPGFRTTVTLEEGISRMIGWYHDTFGAVSRAGAHRA